MRVTACSSLGLAQEDLHGIGLNKNVSDVTAHNIRMKALLYCELWEEFALCLQHVHERFAMALLELPRGCDYRNDERMKFMINGTNSTIHELMDACMV